MISVNTKIHDKFSLEFKIAYKTHQKSRFNNFTLNTWIFAPNSVDINSSTYKREDFYKDIRTQIRLITPVFLLRNIVLGDAKPLKNLTEAMQKLANSPQNNFIIEYEYQIKMFSAIYKSALRDQLRYIKKINGQEEKQHQLIELVDNINTILNTYRSLASIIKVPTVNKILYGYFGFGDEFMTNLTEKELFALLDSLALDFDSQHFEHLRVKIIGLLENEKTHKLEVGYLQVEAESSNDNKDLIFRFGILKKYVESDLFTETFKKRDGVVAEQVYLSIAAGLSMVFATAIAFSFQQQFGNFTMPFFVALVVSYMLKDRIKEYMRIYLAQKMSGKQYDNKIKITIKEREIAYSKEAFDFILEPNVPSQIIKVRNRIPLVEAENRFASEKILLYRKSIRIDQKLLDESTNYSIDGVVEIFRLNLQSFMRKTDNPEVPLFVLNDNENVQKIVGIKNYYLNIVLQYKHDEDEMFKRYRVGFNRDGINSIIEMN